MYLLQFCYEYVQYYTLVVTEVLNSGIACRPQLVKQPVYTTSFEGSAATSGRVDVA